jgi:hypothetical protein
MGKPVQLREAQFQTRETGLNYLETVSIAWQQQPASQKAIAVKKVPNINRKKEK